MEIIYVRLVSLGTSRETLLKLYFSRFHTNCTNRELTKPKSDRLGEKTRLAEPGCPAQGTDASGVTIRFSIWKVRTPNASLVGGIRRFEACWPSSFEVAHSSFGRMLYTAFMSKSVDNNEKSGFFERRSFLGMNFLEKRAAENRADALAFSFPEI